MVVRPVSRTYTTQTHQHTSEQDTHTYTSTREWTYKERV